MRRSGDWTRLTDDELLQLRFKDIPLRIEGTWLEGMIDRLHEELARRGIRFRPHFWLSNEWFSPDGVPGVAIPFYLAHPRLMKLEERQILEVEGGTRTWCMRILRHETGHAIDTAHGLRRRRRWQEHFGRASAPYPTSYRPKPWSRDYVLHLEWWYAQSHPTEDFAETFAVWLRPGSRWRHEYAGWPVLRKLRYVDELMQAIGGRAPAVRARQRVDPLSTLDQTLEAHYRERRAGYGVELPGFYDRSLERVFAEANGSRRGESATTFLRRHRAELRTRVAAWTGQHPYAVEQFLKEMITRCRALGLRRREGERQTLLDVALALAVQVMKHVHAGGYRVSL